MVFLLLIMLHTAAIHTCFTRWQIFLCFSSIWFSTQSFIIFCFFLAILVQWIYDDDDGRHTTTKKKIVYCQCFIIIVWVDDFSFWICIEESFIIIIIMMISFFFIHSLLLFVGYYFQRFFFQEHTHTLILYSPSSFSSIQSWWQW